MVFTSRCNAELIKGCSNAYLALKISFANEVANMCDTFGASSDDVLRGIGYDQRIGSEFLRPGIGFGGPCFEKDVKSMAHLAEQHGLGRELFAATLRINSAQPLRLVDILEYEMRTLSNATIGIWADVGSSIEPPAKRGIWPLTKKVSPTKTRSADSAS